MADKPSRIPKWAEEMRRIFRGGTVSQFVLHGNVHDFVSLEESGRLHFGGIKPFLVDVMFQNFDVVLSYNRGGGIRPLKGLENFLKTLKGLDVWSQTSFGTNPGGIPRDPRAALELIDRYIHVVMNQQKVAVILDWAQYVVPRGEALQISSGMAEPLIRVMEWAADPEIQGSHVATVLIAENLNDLNPQVMQSPYSAKIQIPLPSEAEILEYLGVLLKELPDLEKSLDVPLDALAQKLIGLTRVNVRNLITLAVRNGQRIDAPFLIRIKKELIEKECYGLLDFIEVTNTLDDVAGHDEARKWLREDAKLLRLGKLESIPMGYLMNGRIGTGKTWLTFCWAGEIGIPCVVLKNFRDKWQGSTEGNLEKIFNILHALGQVMVFVDEADQAAGKRENDSSDGGVSGRVYSMLAKEMSDTRNRGRILWVFATSRPDLLEVDLKRTGRLDVHIPLFPPQTDEQRNALFRIMCRKLKMPIRPEDVPPVPKTMGEIGGNEFEALLVRVNRRWQLAEESERKKGLPAMIRDELEGFRPSAHTRKMEYMDLIAVKECTDDRFLPERYRKLKPEEIEKKLAELRLSID
ncbi:MAG: ATP-binding protein [Candidatus Brocadiae bacterium]|nr:ATP-binding protein [Candidatus Brocadiia bacterium]